MPFTWSYSKLKNYENCPKKYFEVDVSKNFVESSDQLDEGSRVHKLLANRVTAAVALDGSDAPYEHWFTGKSTEFGPVPDGILNLPGQILIEQKFALTATMLPTTYFAKNVWWRGIGDLIRIDGPVAHYRDYKTGRLKHDATQLALSAQAIFSHYPKVMRVLCQFIWLGDDVATSETYNRRDMVREWPPILDRVSALEEAHLHTTFPPKPGRLCFEYCPVVSCPHRGKRFHG